MLSLLHLRSPTRGLHMHAKGKRNYPRPEHIDARGSATYHQSPLSWCLPVLLDVEGPLELQVAVVVVVGELRDSLVVATAHHAGGSGLGLD